MAPPFLPCLSEIHLLDATRGTETVTHEGVVAGHAAAATAEVVTLVRAEGAEVVSAALVRVRVAGRGSVVVGELE